MLNLWKILPFSEKSRDDGSLKKFISIFDNALTELKSWLSNNMNKNPFEALGTNLDSLLGSRGIESFNISDEQKRVLAFHADSILKYKGTIQGFKFICKIVLGYEVEIAYTKPKLFDYSNDLSCIGYDSNDEFMNTNVGLALDVASYGYDPLLEVPSVAYTITNYDNDGEKLEVFKYLINKYFVPIEYELITG